MNANEKSKATLKRHGDICRFLEEGHTQKEAAEKWGISATAVGSIKKMHPVEMGFLESNGILAKAADNLGLGYGTVKRVAIALGRRKIRWDEIDPESVLEYRNMGRSCADLVKEAQRILKEELNGADR